MYSLYFIHYSDPISISLTVLCLFLFVVQVSGLPSAKAAPKLRNLFSTAGHIFVASGTSPSPSILKELVVMGGGSVSYFFNIVNTSHLFILN